MGLRDEAPLDVSVAIPGSLSRWLVALFFFPGVGVVDDQVGQGEGSGCFRGGDQAVDRLGLPGEGVRSRPVPRRGQRDLSVLMRVGPIEPRTPALWGRVVVTNQAWVLVRIDSLLPRQARGGGHRVGRPITPGVLVVRCRQRDRDVAAQQVDHVSLSRGGHRDDRGHKPVRVRHSGWLFVDAGSVGMDGGRSVVEDFARRWHDSSCIVTTPGRGKQTPELLRRPIRKRILASHTITHIPRTSPLSIRGGTPLRRLQRTLRIHRRRILASLSPRGLLVLLMPTSDVDTTRV